MSGNVVSLNGAPTCERAPNAACVATLTEWLERAKSGEIVGVALAAQHFDGYGSYSVAGVVGGYSVLGAAEHAKAILMQVQSDG